MQGLRRLLTKAFLIIAPGVAIFMLVLLPDGFAQEMSFSDEESEEQAPAETVQQVSMEEAGPPSEVLANALRLYAKNEHEQAALEFQKVIDGKSGDGPINVQRAQFSLAKSLYHLGFYQSALTVFDEITQQGPAHAFFPQTLRWLAQLATQLPEPAGIVERVGRYQASQIEQLNTGESKDIYHHINYLMGRYKYEQGMFKEAIDLFHNVPLESPHWVKAHFFEGISHVQQRQAKPAVRAFRDIVEAKQKGKVEDNDENNRIVDLAWLSLARTYYGVANRTDDAGDRRVDPRVLGNAVEAWNRIDVGSEYWLDALFEESWAFFLAGEYSRALGNIHTLFSPYFENSHYPEAYLLKAVVFYYNCQMENASAMVAQFHDQFGPVKGELESELAKYGDAASFFSFLQNVRAGKAQLSPRIRGIVSSALSDRTLLRHLAYEKQLREEEARLKEVSSEFRQSAVGQRVVQDVAIAKSFAVDQAGELAKERYNRLIDELQKLQNKVDRVDVEILSYTRGQLSQELQGQQLEASRGAGGDVEVDEEHQVWPFNGEYWRDELGFYRQQVTSRCGR